MNAVIVTLDIDWACEPAIEETLEALAELNVVPTVFTTHRSAAVERWMDRVEVGLHPFFGTESSHGSTIEEVVSSVMALPHNLPAFRCHRFGSCNLSREAMADAGMLLSSNVCTDLEVLPPFRDRYGLVEVPIFLEDGGYLRRGHPVELTPQLGEKVVGKGLKVLLIHPMHFSLNTPEFTYMSQIKGSIDRKGWQGMTREGLDRLRCRGRGIRDLLLELLQLAPQTLALGEAVGIGSAEHSR